MPEITSYPPDAATDARNRAWRTLAQGLAVDVAASVVLAVGPAIAGADFAWTRAYWLTVAGLAVKSAATAAVSFFARKLVPPAV